MQESNQGELCLNKDKEFLNMFAYMICKYVEPFKNELMANDALNDLLKILKEKYGIYRDEEEN